MGVLNDKRRNPLLNLKRSTTQESLKTRQRLKSFCRFLAYRNRLTEKTSTSRKVIFKTSVEIRRVEIQFVFADHIHLFDAVCSTHNKNNLFAFFESDVDVCNV